MRTICDVCERAPAVLFCAADEAALCRSCDDKVHMCNKLASRHVRVGLAEPNDVTRCDICENAPAFFYCEVDGSSLCLQCDMIVHVGGKRTHGRYLLLRQKVEFPGDKSVHIEDIPMQPMDNAESGRDHNQVSKLTMREKLQSHQFSNAQGLDPGNTHHARIDPNMIDLNMRPIRTHGQSSNTQGMNVSSDNYNDKSEGVVPDGPFQRETEKSVLTASEIYSSIKCLCLLRTTLRRSVH